MSVKNSPKCGLPVSPLDRTGNDIRILSLKPGNPTDPIICTLSTASLDNKPRYEALSYVWGDPSICNKIILDKQERNVTVNLFAALRRLRKPKEERQLWVDTLCINQEDDDERTHQVGLMSSIYGLASEVLLWLGDYESPFGGEQQSCNGTTPSVEVRPRYPGITAKHRDVVVGFLFIRLLPAKNAPGKVTCLQGLVPGLSLGDLETGLRTILDFSWWTRVWTVQEVVLAKLATVICGGLQLRWDDMASAALNLRGNFRCCESDCGCPGLHPALASRFFDKVDPISDLNVEIPAAELFHRYRDRFASDPRDYVYALLGMFPALSVDGGYSRVGAHSNLGKVIFGPRVCLDPKAVIRPDYSLDHRVVYANAVVSIIRETRCLDMLWKPREYDRDPLLATWVPDWTAAIDPKLITPAMTLYKNLMVGKCTEHPNPVVSYVTETGTLTLLGVQVDTVARISDALQGEDASAPVADATFPRWRNRIVESQSYPRGGGTYEEAFWRLVAKDRIYMGDHPIRFEGETVIVIRGRTLYSVGPSGYRRIKPGEWRLIKESHEACPLGKSWFVVKSLDQRFFITELGLIGLGPFDTQVGDRVHILAGGKCPFLLRRAGEDGPFTLVGAVFIQGMMYDDADPVDWSAAQPVTLI